MQAKYWFAVALAGATTLALAQQGHRGHPGGADAAAGSIDKPVETARRPGGNREWTRFPVLAPGMVPDGERMAAVLRPLAIDVAELQVFAADGPADRRKVTVAVTDAGARIEPAVPKLGNYHWVVARSEKADEVRVASTVWYFSNPGAAPTTLLQEPKNELEIVPEPLPREHSAYRESEKWNFVVRFNGVPVANQALTLETEFGSRSSFQTDAQGRAVVLFPRDFKSAPQPASGGHAQGPRRTKFVLAAEREDGGKRYLTAFNYTYSADADRNKSLAWGAAFGLLGMVAATPLLRRRAPVGGQGEAYV